MARTAFAATLAALLLPAWAATAEPQVRTEAAAASSPAEPAVVEANSLRPRRLKFRDGPTCVCPQGLSEAEIAAAEQRRRAPPDNPATAESSSP
jgi:hypothetical protein